MSTVAFKFESHHLDKYRKADPEFGPIGMVTYKRTYSRPIFANEVIERREEWLETICRVIEGNVELGALNNDPTATEAWAVEALEYMFYMSAQPPGRGYWMMGTEYARMRGGDALNNCWYVAVRPQSYEDMEMFKGTYLFSHPEVPMPSFPFVFMFDRAMLGGGVGLGIALRNIKRFAKLTNKVDLKIVLSADHPDWDRIRASEEWATIPGIQDIVVTDVPEGYEGFKSTDDREGWNGAVREVIDAHWFENLLSGQTGNPIKLYIDLSDIREYAALIRNFGGTASGPLPLIAALQSVNIILNNRVGKKLRDVDALDIMNLLGRCVVAGNVRRTALIALGDADSKDYVDAKNYTLTAPIMVQENGFTKWEKNAWGRLVPVRKEKDVVVAELAKDFADEGYADPIGEAIKLADELFDLAWKQDNHRWASNNSVYTDEVFKDHHFIAAGIIANGEPGVGNRFLMMNYGRMMDGFQAAIDADAEGLNPCGEVTLENVEPCNLIEAVPYRAKRFGHDFFRVLAICTQYVYRITFAKYMWPATQRVIEKNRRIGVSLAGMQDYFLDQYGNYAVLGFNNGDITDPIFDQRIVDELDSWYKHVCVVNENHALSMGAKPSIKKTTVKPGGTVPKVSGVSSGMHWHYGGYMLQRMRFHETDDNLLVLRACGFPIEKAAKEPNTVVVEFPVKNPNADHPNFLSSEQIPLEVQFANQYLFAYAWADNAVSATLTFQPHETDKIEPLLAAYNNRIKSTSLLPYSGHGYVQAPWEAITEEEYNRRVSELQMTLHDAYKIIEVANVSDDNDADCSTGACPTK